MSLREDSDDREKTAASGRIAWSARLLGTLRKLVTWKNRRERPEPLCPAGAERLQRIQFLRHYIGMIDPEVEAVLDGSLDEEDLVRILHDMEPVKSRFGIDLDDVPIDEAFMSRLRRLAEAGKLEAEGGDDPGTRA